MKRFIRYENAISDLHSRGYSQDFILQEQHLWWVQEKFSIEVSGFIINEIYHFSFRKKQIQHIVLAVTAVAHNVKGIVLLHNSIPSENNFNIRKKYNASDCLSIDFPSAAL